MIGQLTKERKCGPWNLSLVCGILTVHNQIWEDRNTQVHGSMIKECHECLRQCSIKMVIKIYKENPRLGPPLSSDKGGTFVTPYPALNEESPGMDC